MCSNYNITDVKTKCNTVWERYTVKVLDPIRSKFGKLFVVEIWIAVKRGYYPK